MVSYTSVVVDNSYMHVGGAGVSSGSYLEASCIDMDYNCHTDEAGWTHLMSVVGLCMQGDVSEVYPGHGILVLLKSWTKCNAQCTMYMR